MSSKNVVDWMSNNPGTTAGIAVLIIVIVIAIVMSTGNNDKNEEVGGTGKPEIEVIDMSKSLLPDKVETEGYRMYEGYDIKSLAKNINFTLKWNNRGGFETVKSLIFRRYAKQVLVQTTSIAKGTAGYDTLFQNFYAGNAFTFRGNDLTSPTTADVRGVNRFTIHYTTEGSTTEENLFDSGVSFAGVNVPTVTDEDLTLTLSLITVEIVVYKPSTLDFAIQKITDKTVYYIYPGGTDIDIYNGIGRVVLPVRFEPVVGNANAFYINFPDIKKYLSREDTKIILPLLFGQPASTMPYYLAKESDKATAKTFNLIRGSVDDRFRIREAGTTNLFLSMEIGGTTLMVDVDDSNVTADLYNKMDLEITPTRKNVDCRYTDTLIGCDANNKKKYERIIWLDNGKCGDAPSPRVEECDRDEECTYDFDTPCDPLCGSTTATRTSTRKNTVVPKSGNGKACPATKVEDCGRGRCKVYRACNFWPNGTLIANAGQCDAIHGDNCEYITEIINGRKTGNNYCRGRGGKHGGWEKICDAGVTFDQPGCERQRPVTVRVADDQDETYTPEQVFNAGDIYPL